VQAPERVALSPIPTIQYTVAVYENVPLLFFE